MRPQLPPYVRRDETLLERCARLRAELRAVTAAAHANDNARPRPEFWWTRESDPA